MHFQGRSLLELAAENLGPKMLLAERRGVNRIEGRRVALGVGVENAVNRMNLKCSNPDKLRV